MRASGGAGRGSSGVHLLLAALVALLAVTVRVGLARAEWVEWIADLESTIQYHDNLNQTAWGNQEESDFVWTPSLSVGRTYQVGENTRLHATADVRGMFHGQFERLNGVIFGPRLSVGHKFGLGRDVPWARVHVSGYRLDLRESARDSWLVESGLALGKRLSPRLDASLAYLYSDRNGKKGTRVWPTLPTDVYDQQAHQVGLTATYLAASTSLVSVGVQYGWGEFDSTCPNTGITDVLSRGRPEAATRDRVFGSCIYRLDGDIYTGFINLNYALGRRAELDVEYRQIYSKDGSLDYQRNIISMALSYRY